MNAAGHKSLRGLYPRFRTGFLKVSDACEHGRTIAKLLSQTSEIICCQSQICVYGEPTN